MRTALLCIAALLLFTKGAFAQLPAFPDSLKNTLLATMQEGDSLVIVEAFKIYESRPAVPHKPAITELTEKNRRAQTMVKRYRIIRIKDAYTITLYKVQVKKFPNKTIKHISVKNTFYNWEAQQTYTLTAADVLQLATYCKTQLEPCKPVTVDDRNPGLTILMKNRERRQVTKLKNKTLHLFVETLLSDRNPATN